MNAIAAGSASQHNDPVPFLRRRWMGPLWQHTNRAAKDQRIAQIPVVVNDCSIDGWETKFVPVIPDAGDDAVLHTGRVQYPGRQRFLRQVLGTKTEHVRAGDGAGRNGDDVTHNAADARVRAAKWLKGGRVIVRLNFESQIIFVVKLDDTGVVNEGRPHPGALDLFGRRLNIGMEQALNLLSRIGGPIGAIACKRYPRLKCLVDAVFTPCLGQCLQLDIGWRAANLFIVALNLLHFPHVERKHTLNAALPQRRFIQASQGDLFNVVAGVAAAAKRRLNGAQAVALNCFITQ